MLRKVLPEKKNSLVPKLPHWWREKTNIIFIAKIKKA